MGEGPVTRAKAKAKRPRWKLKPPHDRRTQGLVVSGFADLHGSEALFLCFDRPANAISSANRGGKSAWLQTLKRVAPITDADGRDERAAIVAFTWSGLERLGLPNDALESFSAPFREGMYQEDRLRRLGDKIDGKWQSTVIDGGPKWSGNIRVRKEHRRDAGAPGTAGAQTPAAAEERQVITPKTVHALLLLYEKDEEAAKKWADEVARALAPHDVSVVHRLALELRLDTNDVGREHIGFADGLSQPVPFGDDGGGEDASIVWSNGKPAARDDRHGIPLGEILLGHTNAHHERAPGPMVPDDPMARALGLDAEGAPEGLLNFGLDGSYVVVRELRQYVAAFWNSLHANAARIRAHDPGATHVTARWLAERAVGRDIDGHLLCPSGLLAPDEYNHPQNAFGFIETDPQGSGCPPGSHVRRSNPRDGLAKDIASGPTLLDATNNHRILRRGRKYGTTIKDPRVDDSEDRGLLFVCLNTDIARQFEFIQQTWILNRNFATLFNETDPLVGPKGPFTIREQPLRRIVEAETFVQMAGGEYFFLPSIPALGYLAEL